MPPRRAAVFVLAACLAGCGVLVGLEDLVFEGDVVPGDAGHEAHEVIVCPEGRGNCNTDPNDGCEVELASDSKHCGACDHDCYGAACVDGRCSPQKIADVERDVDEIAADEAHLYLLSIGRGSITRIDKDGGARLELQPEGGVQQPTHLAPSGDYLFYSAYYGAGVTRMPRGGGGVLGVDACNTALGVAVAGGVVYAATYVCGGPPRVRRYVPDGGAGYAMTESGLGDASIPLTYGMQQDDDSVYWTNGATLFSLPKTFGAADAPRELAQRPSPVAGFGAMGVDADQLYVLFGDRLVTVDKNDGGIAIVASDLVPGVWPTAIAVDAAHVYFTQPARRVISRVPRGGKTVEVFASSEGMASGVAVDAELVFWVNADDGTVWRRRK